ncbi:MAG: hypothetical protein AAGH15_12485 [Myxococcota bacterium]
MLRPKTLSLLLPLAMVGCAIVDDDPLNAVRAAVDGGTTVIDMGDMGGTTDGGTEDMGLEGPQPVDTCGDDSAFVISETQTLRVDTRGLQDRTNTATCAPSPGRDGFFALDVQANEYWHFHLSVDATVTGQEDLNPVLYLLQPDCDARRCDDSRLSNACEIAPGGTTTAFRDEHFAFIPNRAGRWYIGIDDQTAGAGGVYLLDAIRPVCGNGTPEHGESCENEDFCNEECRFVLDRMNASETMNEPNDNREEANLVVLAPIPMQPGVFGLDISGDIGPSAVSCDYPDVFTLDVPPGARLQVFPLVSGAMCPARAAADFDLFLEDVTGTLRSDRATDPGTGCPIIDEADLEGARFFVRLSDSRPDADRPLNYNLRFRITM